MEFDEMFSIEEKIIRHGEKILERNEFGNSPWKDEYAQLLKNYKKMYKQLIRLIKINDRQQSKLSQANTILEKHSKYDELTGICNRRMFNEMYDREWRRCIRYKHPISMLLFDIDHFKQINDMHGHQAGDEILKMTAQKIERVARRVGDLAARYGGEEFILLLPDTAKMAAFKMAEEIRKDIARTQVDYDGKMITITVSAGLATMVPDMDNQPEKLIKQSDDALYLAKRTGRNRICMFDDMWKEGTANAG